MLSTGSADFFGDLYFLDDRNAIDLVDAEGITKEFVLVLNAHVSNIDGIS